MSMMTENIFVAVIAHKPYRMPEDSAYFPLQVGAALHTDENLGSEFSLDNEGDSISEKNPFYSELTGLWWVWRNVDADFKGLVHYRRYLASPSLRHRFARDPFARIATGEELTRIFAQGADVILPKRRNYVIETVRSHWEHTLPPEQLEIAYKVVADLDSGRLSSFDRVLNSCGAHMFNMSVMRTKLFDEYCAWLFPMLFEVERRLPPSCYDAFNARYLGRVSELFLDVWLDGRDVRVVELPVVSPESVDWPRKISAFLAAKFLGRRYTRSF